MRRWVLLRGLTREQRHWGDFPEHLRRRDGDARIIALDLPGNGELAAERSPVRVEAMLDWCRIELAARGESPPYHLLALSLGAMVAAAWMYARPQEVGGAVLINTSLRPLCPWFWRLRPAALPRLLQALLAAGDSARRERAIFALTSNRPELAASVLPSWQRCHREAPVGAGNALRQLLAAARYRVPETAPAPPVLLLSGAADRLVDPRCSRQIAANWQVAWREHPDAGHDLPLDDPDWVAGRVAEWLAAGASRDGVIRM